MKVFRDDASRIIKKDDGYIEKFAKLIPSEIIALYITTAALFKDDLESLFIIFLTCSILTPLYLMFAMGIKPRGFNKILQIVVSSVSFMIWVANMGGFFALSGINDTNIPLVIMIFWTFFFDFIIPLKLPLKPSKSEDGPE